MKKYNNSIKLAELISKHFNGSISEEENILLEKLLKETNLDIELVNTLKNEKSIFNKIAKYEQFNQEECWKNISMTTKKHKKLSPIRICQYAAAVLLPIIFVITFFIVTKEKTQEQKKLSGITIGTNKAILEVSSGKKYLLDNKIKMPQLNKLGVQIENNKTLKYSNIKDSATKIEYHKVIVPRGGEYSLKLSDGTNIWLFSESEIRYPSLFTNKKREVYLSGEAYFEVSHNPSHPFIVKTKDLNINVLGTSFNVMAYEDMNVVETSLVDGKVSIKNNVLLPNNQAIFDKTDKTIKIKKINANIYSDKKNGLFVFENEKLDNILRELSRWYDFEYFYQNKDMKEKLFGLKLQKYDNIKSILELLEETKEVKFRIKENTIIIKSYK